MRVAVVTHTAQLGGGEIALVRLATGLDERRCNVRFVVFSDGPLVDELRRRGYQVDVLPLDPMVNKAQRHHLGRVSMDAPRQVWATCTHIWRLQRHLRHTDVDVVHANSLKSGIIGAAASRLARRPFVWYIHDRISADYLPKRTAAAVRFAIRRFPTQVLGNSQATMATLGRLPADRGTVAYPGLEDDAFASEVRPRPLAPTFGLIGRISPTKGQDVFVRAAAIVAETAPDARFFVVGAALFDEMEYDSEVRQLASALGLDDRMCFTGHVDDPGVYLRQLSAVVHASPVPEPFGQVVVEAIAAGVPVIATNAGGVVEILDDGEALGLMIPLGDVDELAAAMHCIVDEPETAETRASHALTSARRRFTIGQTAEIVMTCWERASGRHGRR